MEDNAEHSGAVIASSGVSCEKAHIYSALSFRKDMKTMTAATATPIVGYIKTFTTLGLPKTYPWFIVTMTGMNETAERMTPTTIATI
jgi:hypothetical protein